MSQPAHSSKAPAGFWGRLLPRCREVTRLQSQALDRRLPFLCRIGLLLHLLICKWCRRYGRHISFLREASHKCAEGGQSLPAATLSPEARERIQQAIRSNAAKDNR